MTPLEEAVAAAARGGAPPTITLMRILAEASTEAAAREGLSAALARSVAAADSDGVDRLRGLQALWAGHPQAWTVVRATLAGIGHDHQETDPEAVLRYWAAAFDRLSAASPEASVALYSFGSPTLLAAATDEIVALIEHLALLDPERDVLDMGCGIGRMLPPLARRSHRVLGVDIAAGMVEQARRRCAGLPNVRVAQSDGRDLGFADDGSVGLVLAVDVFPYLVQAGAGFADAHVAECARILRPGGAALILNYSYRGDLAHDRRDVCLSATRAGLRVERNGDADLALWDAATFLLRKPA